MATGRPSGEITAPEPGDVSTVGSSGSRPRGGDRLLTRGDALGRYLIVELLGRGGMGVVYRAFDPDLDRAVALKMVRVGDPSGSASDGERARLLREAQAMARLSHPNVITVHDVGIVDGSVFVAMEYVEGTTLKAWLAARPRSWRAILDAYLQAGRGIAAAHAAGIVHRDFKPDNAMIDEQSTSASSDAIGRVRVLDFGLARATGQIDSATSTEHLRTHDGVSLDRSLTVEGAIVGTPAYMSPEQHVGAEVDAASDQFSFCVALFEALYGHRPFVGDSLVSLALAVTQGELQEPKGGRDVPKFVHDAVLRGLSTRAVERHASMEALLAALTRDPRQRWRRAGVGLGALCLLGTAAFAADLASKPSPLCTGAPERMEPVWNESRRTRLQQAFTATELPFAEETFDKVSTLLDDAARSWIDGHTRACRATRVTAEQSEAMLDLRMACLDQRLRELDALLVHLTVASADVVTNSVDAVGRIESVATCDDATRLGTRMGPPADPALAEAVAAQEEVLADVRALLRLGAYAKALERITAVVDDMLELGHPPLSARSLALHAEAQAMTGETKAAIERYQLAFEESIVSADDRHAVDAARELAWLVGSRLVETEPGLRWLSIARALLRRSGGDDAIEASLDTTRGAILVSAGRYEEGVAAHDRAREYWETRDPQHPALARVLDSIGAAEVARGRLDGAVALHRRALSIKRAHYGAMHPEVAASLRELGNALGHTGAFEEALESQREVLEIERQARGETNERVAVALDDMGRSLRKLGRLDEAVEHHRRALEIWKQVLGDPHPSLAVSMLNVGYTLNAANDFAAALAEFERALVTVQSSVGSSHPYAIYAHNAAASALVDLNRHDEALAHVEAVLALENLEVVPTLLAETKFIGANALWPDAPPSAARRARARALALDAREAYAADAERWGAYLEKIDRWLSEHAQ